MMGHLLSMAIGAAGQRSPHVLGIVVEVFSLKQDLAPILRKNFKYIIHIIFLQTVRAWNDKS